MIQGAVNDAYEPIVRFAVQGPLGQSREIEAVVDTGYNGYLMLTPELVSDLGLPFVTASRAFLADGREAIFDVYGVTVLWDGNNRQVDAYVSDATPLVGMRLLHGHNLNIEVMNGGAVAIKGRD